MHVQAAEEELGAVRVELNELLAQVCMACHDHVQLMCLKADVLVVTCPCTDETRNMLDKEALKLMKVMELCVLVSCLTVFSASRQAYS